MYLISIVGALAISEVAFAKVHMVQVAPGDDLVFSPNTIKAAKGDKIQFNFPEGNEHSVAQGDFNTACQPASDAFYSGFAPKGPWTITVDDDSNAIPFYCSARGHCQAGMVGVINPSGDDTFDAYKSAASKTSGSTSPSKVEGGVFKAANAAASSSSPSSTSSSSSGSAYGQGKSGAAQVFVSSIAAMVPLGAVAYMLL